MAFDVLPGLGQPLRRLEDPRLLTGGGRFAANRLPERTLHAVFLRSPHAHARVVSVDAEAARAMPGVAAVITAAETAGLGHNPAITEIRDAAGGRHREPARLPISPDRVRHVGEIVAMVVADSVAAVRDAAEAVDVEYETLPAVTEAEAALAPGAPLLHGEAPGNLVCDWTKGDAAAVEAAFARAAHVARVRHRSPRILASYMETRAALAEWDAAAARVTLTDAVAGRACPAADPLRQHPALAAGEAAGGDGGCRRRLRARSCRPIPSRRWSASRRSGCAARALGAGPHGAPPGRHPCARPRRRGRAGAGCGGAVPGDPGRGLRQFRRLCLDGEPDHPDGRHGEGALRPLRHRRAHIAMRCAFTNTAPVDAGARRGQAGGAGAAGAAGGHCGARDGARPGRAAAAEPGAARRLPVPHRARLPLRQRRLCGADGRRAASGR
jgi:hypothetical protein